jgi:hypothetical protein
MRLSIKIITLAAIVTLSAGCTTNGVRHFVGSAIADGVDTQVSYDVHGCRVLQQRCVQGDFQEWETSDKEMGCSCKKL